ncbi:hypothetical protein H0H93_016199 [Arthromyces matolae]|nr:hypothetical protein H0H93_016199 [Arthromyces matolae]
MVLVKRTKTWADVDSAATDEQALEKLVDPNAVVSDMKTELRKSQAARVMGTALALALIEPKDIQDIHTHMTVLMDQYNHYLPDLPGFDLTRVEAEWSRFRSSIPEIWKFNNDGREFQVGETMKARGLSASHPVILIPGVISTQGYQGLESWSTEPEYRAFFREKLWGGFNMISQVTFNKEKWIAAMMLDPKTGLDPPGVKIRAAEGIDAASSFVHGYWIWSKIVENLAVVNYDTNNLHLAPYDWRLSYYNLEERDGYFSRLKSTIESFRYVASPSLFPQSNDYRRRQGKKVVIAAHSMGSTVLLGVAKAMSAFLSGEMKDTVQMNPAGAYEYWKDFSPAKRGKISLEVGLGVPGGNAVWGNETYAPDDEPTAIHTHGELIAFRQGLEVDVAGLNMKTSKMTAEQAGTWILEQTPSTFQKMLASNYSFGLERDEATLTKNDLDHTKWTNPLEVRYTREGRERDELSQDNVDQVCRDSSSNDCLNDRELLNVSLSKQTWIDASITNDSIVPKVRNGVKMGEGDGTVSLLSLGAMCAEGWKRPRWNPGGIKVVTVEVMSSKFCRKERSCNWRTSQLPHRPVLSIPRGGANTSDHVDILGSTGLNEIILKVATGVGYEIEENYVSNIRDYAKRIEWD